MRAIIPFKKENAKSRLSPLLSEKEREEFATAMLKDVLLALLSSSKVDSIDIMTTSIPSALSMQIDSDKVNILINEYELNQALNDYLQKMVHHSPGPLLIIMADLPLVTKKHIDEISNSQAEAVIVPGRLGGTNVLYLKDPSRFRVDYYGTSFLDHMEIARQYGLKVEVYDSFALSTDIDEPLDLIEVLIHGKGNSARYLQSLGFRVLVEDNRVGIKRG